MKIAVGADHGGFVLKRAIMDFLGKNGYKVRDFGTKSSKRCDYPPIAYKVASAVASGKFDRGVLVCKSSIGMYVTANKVPGIRAAFLYDATSARLSREHNDANVAVFSGNSTGKDRAESILKVWLSTGFSGGRHARRVNQIKMIEKKAKRGR